MTDILGFQLDNGQQAKLGELHRLCGQRMAIKLPENTNSPRCEAYDKIHALDARIEKFAHLLELKRSDSRGHQIPVAPEGHARIVWQYYFIKHPISK
jgi:hypothetical protein